MSGQFRKGTTVPGSYYGPRDYDYLRNSKLNVHAARPHTPLLQKRQVLPNKKLAEIRVQAIWMLFPRERLSPRLSKICRVASERLSV